jgi:hypothetical protein
MVTPIVVSELVVKPGFNQTFVQWRVDSPVGVPLYFQLDRVEVYSSTTNDRGPDEALLATKVAEGIDSAVHYVEDGAARYYWCRPRKQSSRPAGPRYYDDWFPASPTEGVASPATSSIDTNGFVRLPSGLIEQWGRTLLPTGSGDSVSFNIPFPVQCLNVVFVPESGPGVMSGVLFTGSTTGFHAWTTDNTGAPVSKFIQWRAIGY